MTPSIPLARPEILDQDIIAVENVLRSGDLVQGAEVEAFERDLTDVVGTRHAIAVSSGTAALHLALRAIEIGPGDRVAIPAYSFIATANVVALVGATPVFIDIDPDDFCIDVDHLSRVLDTAPNVDAIMPVHAFGRMAQMREIVDLAARHGIPIIEDAACALGAVQDDHPAGGIGALGCFSFHPMKVTTTGEGGCITTNDDRLAELIKRDRNHGQEYVDGIRQCVTAGFNYRLTDVMAALGRSQLGRLASSLDGRRRSADRYRVMLTDVSGVTAPRAADDADTVQSYIVVLDRAISADSVVAKMAAKGVQVGRGTIGMPFTPAYKAPHNERAYPVTLDIMHRALSLPMYAGLSVSEQEGVVSALAAAIEESAT